MNINDGSIFHNKRVDNNDNSTLGILKLDEQAIGFVIEDEPREVKVSDETRIPEGFYELKIREVESGLTKRYREKYDWFEFHIELSGVYGFKYVYVHVGNFESNTSGCQVIGTDAAIMDSGDYRNKNSLELYKKWYIATYKALKDGKRVFWKVTDN